VPFQPEIQENAEFLGERAREIVDQEIDRARSLDTKAAGLVAASLAGLGVALALATKLPDLRGGQGAKSLWAATLVIALVLLVPAAAFAVQAILPQAFRIAVHVNEMRRWITPRVLERDPTQIKGELLAGSVVATEDARAINAAKARRLTRAFYALAAAVLCIVACGASIAIHAAVYADQRGVARQQQSVGARRARGQRRLSGGRPSRARKSASRS
jgi:hypothetical protein